LKLLFIDVETSYNVVGSWGIYGKSWNALNVLVPWHILCFAWKFQHEPTHVLGLDDYQGYKPTFTKQRNGTLLREVSDKNLLLDLWKVLDEAEVVVGHNANRFDVKRINSRFLVHGIGPPSPYKVVDTLTADRSISQSNSHRLDAIGEERKLGRKLPHTGLKLWTDVMSGDPGAWDMMKDYNIQDVDLLERVYNQLLPWMKTHPNAGLYMNLSFACPKCGSLNVQKRGFQKNNTTVHQRYQCQDCGSWSKGATQLNTANSTVFVPSKELLK